MLIMMVTILVALAAGFYFESLIAGLIAWLVIGLFFIAASYRAECRY